MRSNDDNDNNDINAMIMGTSVPISYPPSPDDDMATRQTVTPLNAQHKQFPLPLSFRAIYVTTLSRVIGVSIKCRTAEGWLAGSMVHCGWLDDEDEGMYLKNNSCRTEIISVISDLVRCLSSSFS